MFLIVQIEFGCLTGSLIVSDYVDVALRAAKVVIAGVGRAAILQRGLVTAEMSFASNSVGQYQLSIRLVGPPQSNGSSQQLHQSHNQ